MPYPMQMGKTLPIKDVALLMHAYWTLQEHLSEIQLDIAVRSINRYRLLKKHAVLVFFSLIKRCL